MTKITVTQPATIQRHVLQIAEEKTQEEIDNVIKSLENNRKQPRNQEYLIVWRAYSRGWRGNFADNVQDINSKAVVKSVTVSKKAVNAEPQILSKEYCKPDDHAVAAKFISLYGNAHTRGKEFDLSLADVRRLLTKKRCEYTGIELTKAISSPPALTDRTIDRLDSSIGYVPGNVFAVSHQANALKNALFEKESECKTTVEFIHEMTSRIINLKSKTQDDE